MKKILILTLSLLSFSIHGAPGKDNPLFENSHNTPGCVSVETIQYLQHLCKRADKKRHLSPKLRKTLRNIEAFCKRAASKRATTLSPYIIFLLIDIIDYGCLYWNKEVARRRGARALKKLRADVVAACEKEKTPLSKRLKGLARYMKMTQKMLNNFHKSCDELEEWQEQLQEMLNAQAARLKQLQNNHSNRT